MTLLLMVLAVQAVAIVLVMLILRMVLNRMLIDLAVKHVEVWKFAEAKGIDRILILSHKPLKKVYVDRIHKALSRNFAPHVTADFQLQKSLMGGTVIRVGDQVLDCSLKNRLTQAFKMR